LLLDDVLHAALGLSSGQEALWFALDAEDANRFAQMQALRESTRAAVETELAKEMPDLVLIEAIRADERSAAADAMAKVDSAALALYTNLDAGQQSAVIAAVKAMHAERASRGLLPPRP